MVIFSFFPAIYLMYAPQPNFPDKTLFMTENFEIDMSSSTTPCHIHGNEKLFEASNRGPVKKECRSLKCIFRLLYLKVYEAPERISILYRRLGIPYELQLVYPGLENMRSLLLHADKLRLFCIPLVDILSAFILDWIKQERYQRLTTVSIDSHSFGMK